MKQSHEIYEDTMTRVRLETLSHEHNKLCERVAAKRGRSGVEELRYRRKDALHKFMAAQLHAGEVGKRDD